MPEILSFGGFAIDLAGRSLRDCDGNEVLLTRAEFALLLVLARHPGECCRVISCSMPHSAVELSPMIAASMSWLGGSGERSNRTPGCRGLLLPCLAKGTNSPGNSERPVRRSRPTWLRHRGRSRERTRCRPSGDS